MANYNLTQLANEVPGVLSQVHKSRPSRPPQESSSIEISLFFDFPSYYAEGQAHSPGSRSRSDASSIPGLTAGSTPTPSEEEGSPSPGPTDDQFLLKAEVKVAKQHDDKFTFPEIRPKGSIAYPLNIQLNNAPTPSKRNQPSGKHAVGGESVLPSSGNAERRSKDPLSSPSSRQSRAVRSGPLDKDNRDKVADVRSIRACGRCRMRKLPCDLQDVCGGCKAAASKQSCESGVSLADHMCFRTSLKRSRVVFSIIEGASSGRPTSLLPGDFSEDPTELRWPIYFTKDGSNHTPLKLVVDHYRATSLRPSGWQHGLQQEHSEAKETYRLSRHEPVTDAALCAWSSARMEEEGKADFERALDLFVASCVRAGKQFLPHIRLVQMVHEMKCLYKIWRQKQFYRQISPRMMQEIPKALCDEIRDMVSRKLMRLERDILADLEAFSKPKTIQVAERLPVWASMMQLLLIYREIYHLVEADCRFQESFGRSGRSWLGYGELRGLTMDLFDVLVVMCEFHFAHAKKQPQKFDDLGDPTTRPAKQQLNKSFEDLDFHRQKFFYNIETIPGPLDPFMSALLNAAKEQSRKAKRARIAA
ncbi:hypothetical protein BJ170DRAFT_710262 [Xylariales sp. AK1849]|nr:hypothetical protein BJ170DRAFT_710262 [Xylariales sp. AK1849]